MNKDVKCGTCSDRWPAGQQYSPLDIPPSVCIRGFPLDSGDASTFNDLPRRAHKDPFDQMLVWQAIRSNYHLVTCDTGLKEYASHGLRLFWSDE